LRANLILTLASAFFKSYFRSSRRKPSVSFFTNPKAMLVIDVALFVVPAALLQFILGAVSPPADVEAVLAPIVTQTLISLPLLMTSAVIIAGLMFELGQGSIISSSEAVNWWPVTSREYVAASALSTSSLYSAFLALAAGVTLPLSLRYGLFYVWPTVMLLSTLTLFLGAFIVEALKSIVNRVSASAYKKSGRGTLAMRLIALVFLFAIMQLAFQPLVLQWVLASVVSGIDVAWMVPFVWSSVAVISAVRYDLVFTVLYVVLSFAFTLALYELSCQLRKRYWSPVPILISVGVSTEYIPQASKGISFGFNSFASMLALKEFRALTRRKDLARFIAIPIVISVSILAPVLASPGDMAGGGPGFFLAAMIPLIVPLMFATMCIGQEGVSITHLLCLPVKANDLIKGKLAPAWIISAVITFAVIALMEAFAPLGLINTLAICVVALMALITNSFIGLGVGSRWPDFTVGARSRYITLTGFIVGFVFSGLSTLAIYAPLGTYIISTGGVQGAVPFLGIELLPMFTISFVLGCALMALSYIYCKKGVENLLSNMA
jgi:hypothetical protein